MRIRWIDLYVTEPICEMISDTVSNSRLENTNRQCPPIEHLTLSGGRTAVSAHFPLDFFGMNFRLLPGVDSPCQVTTNHWKCTAGILGTFLWTELLISRSVCNDYVPLPLRICSSIYSCPSPRYLAYYCWGGLAAPSSARRNLKTRCFEKKSITCLTSPF